MCVVWGGVRRVALRAAVRGGAGGGRRHGRRLRGSRICPMLGLRPGLGPELPVELEPQGCRQTCHPSCATPLGGHGLGASAVTVEASFICDRVVPRVAFFRSHLGLRTPSAWGCLHWSWVPAPSLPTPVSHFLCFPKYRSSIPAGHCLSARRLQDGARTPTGGLARPCALSPSSLSLSSLSLFVWGPPLCLSWAC